MYRYNDDISLEDAIHTALLTLKEGFEGQMTEKTIEIGIIGTGASSTTGQTAPTAGEGESRVHGSVEGKPANPVFRKLTEAEIKDYLAL